MYLLLNIKMGGKYKKFVSLLSLKVHSTYLLRSEHTDSLIPSILKQPSIRA